jgi:hypothetical protein
MAAIATASFFMAVSRSIRDYHAACRRLLPLQHREFETVGRALYKVAALNCSERLIMLWDSSARIGAQRTARDDAGNKKAADDMALGSDNHFWEHPAATICAWISVCGTPFSIKSSDALRHMP